MFVEDGIIYAIMREQWSNTTGTQVWTETYWADKNAAEYACSEMNNKLTHENALYFVKPIKLLES